jgi:CBS-domain-containing membrane protein
VAAPDARQIPVSKLMTTRVPTVDVEADASLALRLVGSQPVPCVIVCRDQQPIGSVTPRDFGAVCAVHWPNLGATGLTAGQIMSSPLIVVQPDDKLADLLPLLARADLDCLVVVDDAGRLLGVLERAALLRACARLLGY